MLDRLSAEIGLEILFCRISILVGRIHENMIPGLAFIRLCLVRLIPFLVSLARRVAIDDDAPVSVPLMANELSKSKVWNGLG